MLENAIAHDYIASSSLCDAQGLLGVKSIFDICMDLASEHALRLGVGYADMSAHGCYWLAIRTRVRLYGRPAMDAAFTAETWPAKPGRVKHDRFYRFARGGEVFAEGRTEWAVQDVTTGAIVRKNTYGWPDDLVVREETVCAEPFTLFRDMTPPPEAPALTYAVSSMDIDLGGHMNNVAYIRMLLSSFTTAELAAMDVAELEISYRRACYEGETLTVLRRREAYGWLFQVVKPDGETAVHARLCLRGV